MKKLKRLTAMLLAFVMILSFAACGKDPNAANTQKESDSSTADTQKKSNSSAVGTWSMKLDLSAAMKEEMGSEFAAFDAPFVFTVYLDLNKDGSYKMYVDEKETERDMETFMDSLADFFTEYLYSAMEAQGIDRATAQATLEAQVDMSIKDYALQAIKESIDIDDLTSSMVQEGVYKVNDGKLFMGSDRVDKKIYDLIAIDGDKMTLNAAADADASPFFNGTIPGISYPFELTRVK